MSALRKILVVDDDPVVSRSFDRVLTEKGYVVTTAENAKEALARMQEGAFDLVYTDIRMPGMDGVELAEVVKARAPWTPVVIVTGYGSKENQERAKAAGVSAFLHKPLSPEMIEGSALEAISRAQPAVVVAPEAAPVAAPRIEVAAESSGLKKIALFIGAPFIGLAYAVLLPFFGLGLLAVMAFKALTKGDAAKRMLTFAKNVGLFIAAPFIGLAYVVMMPFVGLGTLAWMGWKALTTKKTAE